jgi:hypothetical protein
VSEGVKNVRGAKFDEDAILQGVEKYPINA